MEHTANDSSRGGSSTYTLVHSCEAGLTHNPVNAVSAEIDSGMLPLMLVYWRSLRQHTTPRTVTAVQFASSSAHTQGTTEHTTNNSIKCGSSTLTSVHSL